MFVKEKNDFDQPQNCKCFMRALKEDKVVTSSTILILLAGINIAAIIGDSMPCTAKDKPTILYIRERIKLAVTIFFPDLAKAINLSINFTFEPSKMASHAGEN